MLMLLAVSSEFFAITVALAFADSAQDVKKCEN